MSETWKRWEGQVVNGQFPLLRYLGGSDHSAVFLTESRAGTAKVAIKLIPAVPESAENQLRAWNQSAQLTHPHLVSVIESGRCELEGTPLLFVVMESAEEDLSQILPERALSPDEVRQLLPPVLEVLAYLHGRGSVHGRLRPSNILAAGDQVKVSGDTIRRSGELASPGQLDGYAPPEEATGKLTPAADMWSLAVTVVEVLTQRRPGLDPANPSNPSLPAGTPEPFAEIARGCLQAEPEQRWTVAQIEARLQAAPSKVLAAAVPRLPVTSGSIEKKAPAFWLYAFGLIAVIAVIAAIVLAGNKTRRSASSLPSGDVQVRPDGLAGEGPPEASTAPATIKSAPAGTNKESRRGRSGGDVVRGEVLEQVMPQVSPGARRTIDGRFSVTVRVKVDSSGKVSDARLVSPGPSKYFARLSLEAAREWKFRPAQVRNEAVESEWNLRFGFRRSGTDVVPTPISP